MSTKISNIDDLKEFCEIGEAIDCFIMISEGVNRDKSICRIEEDLFSVIDESTGHEDNWSTDKMISTDYIIGHAMSIGTFYTYANK